MMPLSLDLAGRRVVAVGGGPVAARRVRDFLAAGAEVQVVAPQLCPALAELVGEVTWHSRCYRDGDLEGAWLVHTATGDPLVDARVAADAERRRAWCVHSGRAARGSAAVPARTSIRTADGEVTLAVNSGDPRRSVAVRDYLAGLLPEAPLQRRRPALRHRATSLRRSA